MSPAEAVGLVERGSRYQLREDDARRGPTQLFAREREVLWALTSGPSNEAIASQMCIGTETVRSHVVRILDKLGVRSRLQAAILASRHGYAEDDDAFC